MNKRARFSRDLVALATIVLCGASIAACEGGPGTLGGSGLSLNDPPPVDDSYRGAIDADPPVTDGLGNPVQGGEDGGPSRGKGGSSSSGKGGSDSGKGGSDSGPTATCGDVVAAFDKCPEIGAPAASVEAICAPYSNACKACVANLDCAGLTELVAGGGKPEASDCANDCSDGGTGGTGGSSSGGGGTGGSSSGKGGTGGTGGSSSGKGGTGGSTSTGNCANDLVAKSAECDQIVTVDKASQLCALAPACGSCAAAASCSALEAGACDQACNPE